LALVRLNDELTVLHDEAVRAKASSSSGGGEGCLFVGFGGLAILVGFAFIVSNSGYSVFGVVLLIATVCILCLFWSQREKEKSNPDPRLKAVEEKIAVINQRIGEQRKIVDS
jgi:hypothetical protein